MLEAWQRPNGAPVSPRIRWRLTELGLAYLIRQVRVGKELPYGAPPSPRLRHDSGAAARGHISAQAHTRRA